MLVDDILAIIIVISFGGYLVSWYYIKKYEQAKPPKNTDFLKLQRKVTGIVALVTFTIFSFVNEDSKAEEIFSGETENKIQSVEMKTETNFADA